MWRYVLLMSLAVLGGPASSQTSQQTDRPPERTVHDPPLDAKPLIKHCWAISLELRSSQNPSAQRNGAFDTAWCLEKEIIRHASALMDDDAFARPIEEQLENLRTAYGRLYWSIYNDVRTCRLTCGSMYYSIHNLRLAHLYEKMLTDIIAQRNEYGA